MLSDDEIRRAAYLHEGAVPDSAQRERWRLAVARGDQTLFDRRLAWGIASPDAPDRTWVLVASRIAESSALSVARDLLQEAGPPLELFSNEAYAQLQQWLSNRLNLIDDNGMAAVRLRATWVLFWVEAVSAFLGRLRTDSADLQSTFGIVPREKIVRLIPSLSDHHERGNSVILVEFLSGIRLIYKPKSLESDVAFQGVLEWCGVSTLRILPRPGYGWMEYFAAGKDPGAAPAKRAGTMAAILYALRATDCHRENVLMSGEAIALVDAETLMHPDARSFVFSPDEEQELDRDMHPLFESINRIGLLTRWDNATDMGAFAALPAIAAPEVLAGFRETYVFLLENRDRFLASGAFRKFKSLPVRFIFRATKIYDSILKRSLRADSLASGIDRSIEIDLLSRAFTGGKEKPYAWLVLEAETEALAVGDIPHFSTPRDSTALKDGLREPIEDYFKKSGYDRCVEQILSLSPADLQFQESIINASFLCKGVVTDGGAIPRVERRGGSPTVADYPVEAQWIGESLRSSMARTQSGSPRWIMLGAHPTLNRLQIQPALDDLYSGNSGMALFLAALYRATGDPAWSEMALSVLAYMKSERWRSRISRYLGIGGMTGIGSVVYGLVQTGDFLGVNDLLPAALEFAAMITPERIRSDLRFDVMSGAAGAALGLLALYRRTQDAGILRQAEGCGRHLHESYEPRLTGFAHGAAGIAYAMQRLYDATGSEEFLLTVGRAVEFERRMFSAEFSNWPDLRSDPAEFPVRWCHGAAGIGLGRIGMKSAGSDPHLQAEILAAVQASIRHSRHDVDHLCCGNAGRLELLLEAGLRREAESLAESMIARMRLDGGYFTSPDLPAGAIAPGLFQGISGIGYAMLRLGEPERYPCVLRLEGF